jgi:hypothetical protein
MSCDVLIWCIFTHINLCQTMSTSRRSKRPRTRVTVYHDDVPSKGDATRDITITRSSTGRLHSATLASEPKAGASDSTDPWTIGFFDKNSEPFVVDSLPDELQDFDMPDSQLEPSGETEDRFKVLSILFTLCALTDKTVK